MDAAHHTPPPQPISMPDAALPIDAETLRRVLERHGVSQTELAEGAGFGRDYIARMVSGQYPVHWMVWRWLYTRTLDTEIVRLLLGGKTVTFAQPAAATSMHAGLAESARRMHELIAHTARAADQDALGDDDLRAIDAAAIDVMRSAMALSAAAWDRKARPAPSRAASARGSLRISGEGVTA